MMEKFENPLLEFCVTHYNRLVAWSSNLQSLFLFWMRLTWGHQFFLTGSGKLASIDKTIEFFTSLGIVYPVFHAHLVAYLELIGGTCLILGFASRLAALPLVIIMFVALTTAHVHVFTNFLFFTNPSSLVNEAPYPFLITSLLVLIFGPGRLSIDAWIKRWVNKQRKY